MGLLKVRYEEEFKQGPYTIWFNPGVHNVEEASTYQSSFEGCIDFVVEQFCERAKPCLGRGFFKLEVEGDLPYRQKHILESIVHVKNQRFLSILKTSACNKPPHKCVGGTLFF